MNAKDILKTANANLLRSKVRTFFTVSAIFMGALTLMLTTGVGYGLRSYVDEQVAGVGAEDALVITVASENGSSIGNEPKEYNPDKKSASGGFMFANLNRQDLEKILAHEGIVSVTPSYPVETDYVTNGDKRYTTILAQGIEGLNQPLKAGRLVNSNTDEPEVTLPPAFVSVLGFRDEQDALDKHVTFAFTDAAGNQFTQEAKVVGVQEKTIINNNAMTANPKFLERVHDRMTEGLPSFQKEQYFIAFAKFDANMSDEQLVALKEDLRDQGYNAETLEDQLGTIKSVINGIITFLNIFAAITLLAASFGIVNTLLMAVQERTREIGLMKALGMGRRRIFTLFSLEAVMLGVWGSVIALLAANLIGRIGNRVARNTVLKDFEGLELMSFPLTPMLLIIALIMTIAFIASTLPARRASKLDPIEALRYE